MKGIFCEKLNKSFILYKNVTLYLQKKLNCEQNYRFIFCTTGVAIRFAVVRSINDDYTSKFICSFKKIKSDQNQKFYINFMKKSQISFVRLTFPHSSQYILVWVSFSIPISSNFNILKFAEKQNSITNFV